MDKLDDVRPSGKHNGIATVEAMTKGGGGVESGVYARACWDKRRNTCNGDINTDIGQGKRHVHTTICASFEENYCGSCSIGLKQRTEIRGTVEVNTKLTICAH